jgi:flagellar hook-length control protein FliK
MQIDMMSGAATDTATAIEPNNASPEAPASGPGSFADLLNAAAGESSESTPAGEAADEDVAGDEWMTVPVFVPSFVPVIPQEVIEDEPAGSNVEAAIDADSSINVSLTAAESAPSSVVSPLLAQGAPVAAEKAEAAPVVESQPTAASASSAAVGNIAEAGDSDGVVENVTSALSNASNSRTSAEQPAATTKPAAMPKVTESVEAKASSAAEASPAASTSQGAPREGASPRVELPQGETQNEPAARAKGVAARFARALERAAEPSAVQQAEVAAGDQGQSFEQSGDEQPSLGEWLREQLPLAAARTQPMGASTFSIVSPLQNDARVGGMLASSAGNVTPGMPAMPSERDVTAQIVQSMRLQFRDGIGEAVLTLKPEHLGTVSISLRVENGGLKASVQAEMPEVRQWLQSQQDSLRSALSEHGLRLDRFDVEPDGRRQSSSSDTRDEEPTRKRQPRRSAQVDEPVFEVVV